MSATSTRRGLPCAGNRPKADRRPDLRPDLGDAHGPHYRKADRLYRPVVSPRDLKRRVFEHPDMTLGSGPERATPSNGHEREPHR